MDSFLLSLQFQFAKGEIPAFFACEILYIVGIIFNLILYLFFKRKSNTKRYSDFLTAGIFSLNSLILGVMLCRNLTLFENINFPFLEDCFLISNNIFFVKFLISLFGLSFVLVTYRLLRKTRIKQALLNAILLAVFLFSSLLFHSNNFVATYILLEICVILTYKYASCMRVKKYGIYSFDFVLISLTSSVLFLAFCCISFFVKENIQQTLILICMTIAFLLKLGIFPVYNYLNDRNYKTNIPYAILLFSYLPLVSVVAFDKLITGEYIASEIFQITISAFLIISLICFSLFAIKQKNLVKFFASSSYCLTTFALLNIVLLKDAQTSINLVLFVSFCMLALMSLMSIIVLNFNCSKIKISTIKGMFLNNKLFAILFSILLLILSSVIPSKILISNLEILKNIYLFDNIGIFVAIVAIGANMLIMFNSFVLIKNCYYFDKNMLIKVLEKRTTLNYVVPFVVILFLILSILL